MLVDANQHVDREGAVRGGVGFYGKNTMLITRTHGSWVVLGDARHRRRDRAERPARARLRLLHPLHRRLPDGRPGRARRRRRDEVPLLLDAGARAPIPEPYREELGAQVYGCDICQDVCPWNRGIEKRRAGERAARGRGARRLAGRLAAPRRARSCATATRASTSRGTTRATCGETLLSPRATRPIEASWKPYARMPRATTSCSASTPSGRWPDSRRTADERGAGAPAAH